MTTLQQTSFMIELSDALDRITDEDLAWHERNGQEIRDGEKVFAVLEDVTLRKLKTLAVRLLGQAQELRAKSSIETDPEQAKQLMLEAYRKMSLHQIANDIFFHCAKDETGLWQDHLDETTKGIGIRKGWRMVTRKKDDGASLADLLRNLFEE